MSSGLQRGDGGRKARGLAAAALVLILSATAGMADVFDARRAIDTQISRAHAEGWVVPSVRDLDRYHGEDLMELQRILEAAGADDCRKAVLTALYLDAHLPPDIQALFDDYAMSLLGIWKMPDEWDLILLLASGWGKVVLDGANTGRKVVLTPDAILEANRQRVAQNRARWVQEIVQHALLNGWDEAIVQRSQDLLRDKAERNVAEIEAEMALAAEAMRDAMAARDAAHAEADRRFRQAYEDIFGPSDVSGAVPERDVGNDDRLRIIENVRDDAKAVADRAFDAALSKIEARRNHELGIDLLDVAQARLQSMALSHYVLPVVTGRCAEVSQRMPLKDPPKQPVPADPKPGARTVAPTVGHWALVGTAAKVTLPHFSQCYDEAGTVDDGVAEWTVSKPRCSDPSGSFSVSYSWASPPEFFEPGQRYEVSATLKGAFEADWGDASLDYTLAVSHPDACQSPDNEEFSLVRTAQGGPVSVSARGGHVTQGAGVLIGPDSGFGYGGPDTASRFEVRVCANSVGSFRYIYEWRDGD